MVADKFEQEINQLQKICNDIHAELEDITDCATNLAAARAIGIVNNEEFNEQVDKILKQFIRKSMQATSAQAEMLRYGLIHLVDNKPNEEN